jgi:hypothetical protein
MRSAQCQGIVDWLNDLIAMCFTSLIQSYALSKSKWHSFLGGGPMHKDNVERQFKYVTMVININKNIQGHIKHDDGTQANNVQI